MVVAVCIEFSNQRGAGHLFRAIVLAKELRCMGKRVLIVVNDCTAAIERLREARLEYHVAPVGSGHNWEKSLISEHLVDIWINDRLDTDAAHGMAIKSQGIRLVTFDDRGGGAHMADLNVSALAGINTQPVPGNRVLTGEEWLVLNPDFLRFRRQRTSFQHLLVTMGGSDTYGVTLRIVRLFQQARRTATVVTGPLFAHKSELESMMTFAGINWCSGVPDMGELFYAHDLAITGGGITPFEAAATGLPVVVVANEFHEIPAAQRLEKLGCARFAGYHETLDESMILSRPDDICGMSAAGMNCIPLDGVRRVCEEILHG
jgi:spore coat polysaccharide biosynthesis predicted glycosyltransferase SpsG